MFILNFKASIMLIDTIPCYERPPVLKDHFGLAEGVVSQDRDHSTRNLS